MRKQIVLAVLVLGFAAGMFLSRPFRLGVDYTFLGTLIMLSVGGVAAASFGNWRTLANGLKLAAAVTAFWWFLAFHSYAQGSGGGAFAFTAMLTNSLAALGCALFFSSVKVSDGFLKFLVLFVVAMTVSAVVTFGLYLVGIPFKSLVWGNLPVEDSFYSMSGDILFPFSIAYNYQYYGSIQIPRMSFGVREVGITQAFLGWVAIAAIYYYRFNPPKILLAIFTVAILFTQSTTFIVTALIILMVIVAGARINIYLKFLIFAASSVLGLYSVFVWLNDSTFGYASKVNSESLTDRTGAIDSGLANFSRNPFGIGLYNSEAQHASITLVAQLQEIGVFGAVGFALLLVVAHRLRSKVGGSIVPYLPILAAAITTQPLLDSPGFMPLLFACVLPLGERTTGKLGAHEARLRSSMPGHDPFSATSH